ncbi:hypothetical protein KJ781_00810 [Patescibacteria group bacterium]|nr:hypothetical protein [Patescibacteria group bacterium]MBU1448847.1 hypothetical protein [Patescibacteria group bacterium]MBU2613429.1 hypothetical protein [Patescibacteria group bacterium]
MNPRYLVLAALLLSPLLTILPASATSAVSEGDLVKIATRPDLYYVGPDMKRYVFPNEKTYFTWYAGFDAKVITDAELAALPVGGAVTYRPGHRMVKLTTDPRTYAVDANGTLRWVETETVAAALYGSDWNMKIEDLPDAFFATYRTGASIASASDFVPNDALIAATSIAKDKGLTSDTIPPVVPPVTVGTLDVTVSKPTAQAGDVELLTASGTHPTGVYKMEIFFDGNLIKTCTYSPCAGEATVPTSGTKTSYEARAILTALDASTSTQAVTITVSTDGSSLVQAKPDRAVIRTNQSAGAVVTADISIAVLRIDVYVGGSSKAACTNGARECRWGDIVTDPVGTVLDVYGKVTDTIGRTYTSAHSSITVSDNDSPVVTTTPAKPIIYVGEGVDVTVAGSDDDGITKLEIMQGDVVIKTCESAAPCTVTTGPWMSTGTLTFMGRATDGLSLTAVSPVATVAVQ